MSPPEKDCTNNEKDEHDQTSSQPISIKDQAKENTHSIEVTTPSNKASWLCTICSFLMLLIAPNFVMLFTYTIVKLDGSVTHLIDMLSSQNPRDTIQQIWWPYVLGNYEVWTIIAVFATFELLLMIILPGRHYTGSVTPKGNVPHYKENGLMAFILTIATFGLIVYCNIFNPSIIYDDFMYLVGALNLLGLNVSVVLFVFGKCLPSTSDVTNAGLIADFYQGIELHPRILNCDVKLFTNSRFGMMGWALLLLSYAYKQYEVVGEVTDSMAVAVSLQLIYIMKFFCWEPGYTKSLDIMHDRAGFYIVSTIKVIKFIHEYLHILCIAHYN